MVTQEVITLELIITKHQNLQELNHKFSRILFSRLDFNYLIYILIEV
jgi:hypothetical protein